MSIALYSFSAVCEPYIFSTVIPFCLNMHSRGPTLNGACIGFMALQQILGKKNKEEALWGKIRAKSRSEHCFINTLLASAQTQMKEKRPCECSTYAPIQSQVQH